MKTKYVSIQPSLKTKIVAIIMMIVVHWYVLLCVMISLVQVPIFICDGRVNKYNLIPVATSTNMN